MTMKMISAGAFSGELVSRVALNGKPARFRGWDFTIDDLMRRTTGRDWLFDYMKINPISAARIAAEIRREAPWEKAIVYEGEIMPRVPNPSDIAPRVRRHLSLAF